MHDISSLNLHTIGQFDELKCKFEIYHIYSDQSHTRFIISKRGVCDKKVRLEYQTLFCRGGGGGGGGGGGERLGTRLLFRPAWFLFYRDS